MSSKLLSNHSADLRSFVVHPTTEFAKCLSDSELGRIMRLEEDNPLGPPLYEFLPGMKPTVKDVCGEIKAHMIRTGEKSGWVSGIKGLGGMNLGMFKQDFSIGLDGKLQAHNEIDSVHFRFERREEQQTREISPQDCLKVENSHGDYYLRRIIYGRMIQVDISVSSTNTKLIQELKGKGQGSFDFSSLKNLIPEANMCLPDKMGAEISFGYSNEKKESRSSVSFSVQAHGYSSESVPTFKTINDFDEWLNNQHKTGDPNGYVPLRYMVERVQNRDAMCVNPFSDDAKDILLSLKYWMHNIRKHQKAYADSNKNFDTFGEVVNHCKRESQSVFGALRQHEQYCIMQIEKGEPVQHLPYNIEKRVNAIIGQDTMTFQDGSKYSGYTYNGVPCFKGNHTAVNGILLYTGSWSGLEYHGQGVLYKKGIRIFKGFFSKHQFDGQGKCMLEYDDDDTSGTLTAHYVGEWSDNELHGQGVLYTRNTERKISPKTIGRKLTWKHGRCTTLDNVVTYIKEMMLTYLQKLEEYKVIKKNNNSLIAKARAKIGGASAGNMRGEWKKAIGDFEDAMQSPWCLYFALLGTGGLNLLKAKQRVEKLNRILVDIDYSRGESQLIQA